MSQKFLSDVTLSTVTAGSMLKLDANGKIVEAVDGTDYISTSSTGFWTASSGSGIYYSDDVRIGTYQTTIAPDAKLHVFDYQTTEPKLLIEDGNTGDASMQFKISTQSYTIGVDNSDSDKFVLSAGSVLGTGNLLEITSNGLAAFQDSVLIKGTLYINNQEQIQQGATEKIATFQNLGTERGYFEVTDTGKGYFYADGFKTGATTVGFLKSDGTVDTGDFFSGAYSDLSGTPTLGTMAAASANDYKTSDQTENYVAGELTYSNISGTPTLGTAAAADTTDFDAAGTAASEAGDVQDNLDSLVGTLGTAAYTASTDYATASHTHSIFTGNSGYIEAGGNNAAVFSITSRDRRAIKDLPRTYPRGLYLDFKNQDIFPEIEESGYRGQMIWRSYGSETDLSGGQPLQMVYTQSGNLYFRLGTGLDTWQEEFQHIATRQWVSDQSYLTSLPAHEHDARYYTETEMDTFLSGKLSTSGGTLSGALNVLYNDHANGTGWDKNLFIGTSDDLGLAGAFPTYVPSGSYGFFSHAYSDGVFIGSVPVSAGATNYYATIAWGDDATEYFQFLYKGTQVARLDTVGRFYAYEGNSEEWNAAYGWGNHALEPYATTDYVDTAVSNLVDTAPAALNTLNELAAALGDDENFSTTVSNNIGAVNQRVTDLEPIVGANTTDIATNRTEITNLSAAIPTNNNQLTNGAGYITAVPSEYLTEAEGNGRYTRKFYFNIGSSGGSLRYLKLFTTSQFDDGVVGILSSGGDYGDPTRASYQIHVGTRTSIDATVFQLSQGGVSDDFSFYYRDNGSGQYEVWCRAADYNYTGQTEFVLLSDYGDVTYNFDSVTTTAPTNLVPINKYGIWHSGNFNPTDKASTESVAAVNTRIEEEVFPAIDTVASSIPTNNNQLTNGAGYITGYTETDTLNTVTGRGATTTNGIQVGSVFAAGTITDNATSKGQMLNYAVASFKPSSQNSGTLAIAQVDNGNSVGMQFTNGAGTADWDIALQPFGGKVGVGKVAPVQTLDVAGSLGINGSTFVDSSRGSIRLNSSNVGAGNGIFFRDGFNYNASITVEDHNGSYPDGICISGYDGVSFSTGSNDKNERMRITTAGKVGIGTTDPSEKLSVVGNATIHSGSNLGTLSVGRSSSQNIKIYVDDTNNTITAYQDSDGNSEHIFALDRQFDGTGANNFFIRKGGSNQLKLDTSGNLRLYSYGAGILKTDANGNVSLDTSAYALQEELNNLTSTVSTIATDVSNNRTEITTLGTNKLDKSGGTMTGALVGINATFNSGAAYPLRTSSGQRYGIQVRNTANTVNANYGWWWFMDTNFNMGFHADGAADRFTLTRNGDLSVSGKLSAGNGMWVNGNNATVYNNYNENLRLPPAGNNVSVIAFRATGEGGQPSSSILGYSDRHEVRINGAWKQRIYAGSIDYSSPIVVTGDIYTSSELNLPNTHSKTKIQLHGDGGNAHSIGTESFHNTYGPSAWTSGTLGHKFYGATNSLIATLGEGGSTSGRNTSTFYGNVRPSEDRVMTLGEEALRWQIVFCEILDSAGQHEKNLQNPEGEKSIGEYETGTVLVWKGGKNVPCTEAADHMRMGIAVKGIDSPLIQGAEPVLVTGSVNEGDYLVTSSVEGHAKAITPQFMRQHGLYDCVLGKALESAEGKSHLVKTWINI